MQYVPMIILLSSVLPVLGGCATTPDSDYPSLARRAIELRVPAATVPSSPQPALPEPVTADLATAIAALDRDAMAGASAFAAGLPAAQTAVAAARGAAVESETWVLAQLAISRLDQNRAPTTVALAEADRLVGARGVAGEQAGAVELTALQARIATIAAEQRAALDQLLGALSAR